MATFSAVFAPANTNATFKVSALVGQASSAEQLLSKNAKFVVVATPSPTKTPGAGAGVNVKFGQTGMAAADATGFFIPLNTYVSFDLSNAWTAMRFWNQDLAANTVDIYIMQLAD